MDILLTFANSSRLKVWCQEEYQMDSYYGRLSNPRRLLLIDYLTARRLTSIKK